MNIEDPETTGRKPGVSNFSSRFHRLGTASLLFGAVISALVLMETTTGLPFQMPRSWYVTRPIWLFLGVAGFVGGYFLLRQRRYHPEEWKPKKQGVRFERLVLYTREDCHLCDDAKEVLQYYRVYLPELEEVDIDSDPQLVEKYGNCVPVVEIDGKVRFRGHVNDILLRRLIEGAS